MINSLIQSSKIVNRYLVLIVIIGILNVTISSGFLTYISLLGVVVASFMTILINGRVVEILESKEKDSAAKIVKENWINYFIVVILLALSVFLINYLIKFFPVTGEQFLMLKEATKTAMWMLTLFVMPIVFLKKEGIVAIFAGIAYLFSNLRQGMVIFPYIILMFMINSGAILWFINQAKITNDLVQVLPVMILSNVVSTYFSFIVFTSACNVLVMNRKQGNE